MTNERSSPAAQALVAGLLQGLGARDKDEVLVQAGERLAQQACKPGGKRARSAKAKRQRT